MKTNNTVSRIFAIIAIVEFVIGGIGSFILICNEPVIGIAAAIGVFVSGMLFLGIAEIIRLLQICADNTAKQPKFFSGEADIIANMEAELPEL